MGALLFLTSAVIYGSRTAAAAAKSAPRASYACAKARRDDDGNGETGCTAFGPSPRGLSSGVHLMHAHGMRTHAVIITARNVATLLYMRRAGARVWLLDSFRAP